MENNNSPIQTGIYLTWEAIGALLVVASMALGFGYGIFLLCEFFYIAQRYIKAHIEGFIFSLMIMGLLAALAFHIYTIRQKQKRDDYFRV